MEKTMTVEITNDISTRLLAQENLLINRAPVNTASFDVKNRILTLPMWQNMTPEIEEMLKAHEVGHAIYTDETLFAKLASTSKVPFGYLNVLEDARIEKLMKRKYPGLRKTFTAGYRELNDRDFFQVRQRDISNVPLIDRINLWFKVGFQSGVRFTVAEKYLVERAERLETVAEVISLATAVYELAKKDAKRKREERENDAEYKKLKLEEQKEIEEDKQQALDDAIDLLADDDQFDDDDWASDVEYKDPDEIDLEEQDKDKEELKVKGSQTDETVEQAEEQPTTELPEEEERIADSFTQNAFHEKLSESADTSTKYVYLGLPDTNKMKHVRIGYKTVVAETTAMIDSKTEPDLYGRDVSSYFINAEKNYDTFRTETSRVVNYLIKEFEMKKAASDYKRTAVAKTGVLDVRKLASYKIREDLFKQITITKDGQKHGMVFTIDWSGSMDDYLQETVKQLISLTTFCYRLKIPFEVYAFSDSCEFTDLQFKEDRDAIRQPNTLQFGHTQFQMIELLSHKMTLSEFNRMCRNLYLMSETYDYRRMNAPDATFRDKYQLNGTPLNEAMVWLYNYLGEFKQNNQVEKLTLIKLTDGDASGMRSYYEEIEDTDETQTHPSYISTTDYSYDPTTGERKRMKIVTMISDKFTKKSYVYDNVQCTNIICKMIQDRHDAAVVGYHVVGKGRRELMWTVQRYLDGITSIEQADMAIKIRKGFNEEMFYPVTMTGHDELFLLPNNMKVDDTELDDAMGNLSSGQIAKKFGKYLGAKKTSRVLLNRFVAAVA
jgi:hypothetical protein